MNDMSALFSPFFPHQLEKRKKGVSKGEQDLQLNFPPHLKELPPLRVLGIILYDLGKLKCAFRIDE